MSHMYIEQTFELHLHTITFCYAIAGEAELKEGYGSAGNVTLLAEKPLGHNGFLTLENEVIQRHYSFENAFNSVTEETFIFVLQGNVEV